MPSPIITITRKKDRLRQKLEALVPGVAAAIDEANAKSATELASSIRAVAPRSAGYPSHGNAGHYADSINAHPVEDTKLDANGNASIRADQTLSARFRHTPTKGPKAGQTISKTGRAVNTRAWGIFAAWWWRYIEFGAKGHIIKPKAKKMLVFKGKDGAVHRAKAVHHPGAAAQPHIFPTYRAYRKRIRSRMARGINQAIKQVASRG